jgi:hypothetical protein
MARKAHRARPIPRTATTPAAPPTQPIFAPGPPPRGIAGLATGSPRQWALPPGYNLTQRPRASEQTTFEQLRNLAALYDGIQICERVYFDVLGRLELRVLPRPELLAVGEDAAAPRWREPARRIEAFLETPDRAQDLRSWLVAFVRDLLEIDAVAVYTRRTRSGGLAALELIAGETIKPLLNDAGRAPQPPRPPISSTSTACPPGRTPLTSSTTCARPPAPTAPTASRASSASSCASTRRCASKTSTSRASPTAPPRSA